MSVILNEVKNLVESMGWKTEILRLMPQNDITTQSPPRGERGRVRGNIPHSAIRTPQSAFGLEAQFFTHQNNQDIRQRGSSFMNHNDPADPVG